MTWGDLEGLWDNLGRLWGGFGTIWSAFGMTCGDLGRLWGDLGRLWGDFGSHQELYGGTPAGSEDCEKLSAFRVFSVQRTNAKTMR